MEALEKMLSYLKFMNDFVTKKRTLSFEPIDNMHHCSAIASRFLVEKKEYSRAFIIPGTIGSLKFSRALYDLGVSINLVPLVIFKKLELGHLN